MVVPCPPGWGFGLWLTTPLKKKFTVTEPKRRPRLTQNCSASKEEEEKGSPQNKINALQITFKEINFFNESDRTECFSNNLWEEFN
jgi:hypothetical protein